MPEIKLIIILQNKAKNGATLDPTNVTWELQRPGADTLSGQKMTTDKGELIIEKVDLPDTATFTLRCSTNDFEDADFVIKHNWKTKKEGIFTISKQLLMKAVTPVGVGAGPVTVENTDRDWLGYESVFNRIRNRKPNKKFEMGLYVIARSDAKVWFRDEIDAVTLKNLTAAFFPDFDPEKHKAHSNSSWEWKNINDAGELKEALTPPKVSHVVSAAQIVINLDSYIVLPYNFYDNDDKSRALGTKELNDQSKQLKEDLQWDFWKTASRSCIVRLKRIKARDDKWEDFFSKKPKWSWDFHLGIFARGTFVKDARGSYVKEVNYLLDKPLDPSGYKLSEFKNVENGTDVSLKTGVMFVGSEPQSGSGNKDFLDDNWIVACLRSDYVAIYNKLLGKNFDQPDLMILTELVSITEKNDRVAGEKKTKLKDGIQVRDLVPLDKNKIYLAPLNIPYVDIDLLKFKDDFACLDKEVWRNYWKRHWAASLGKAKSLFLLRYGLQHINPNPQNYLIEFEPDTQAPKPTGRIIIRDLQDAALHREIIWAIHGPEGEPPPAQNIKLEDVPDLGSKLKLEVLKYEFSKNATSGELNVKDYQETGSTNVQFGPPGTQFLWQRFSAFTNGTKVLASKDEEPIKSKWKELLATMVDWGKAHNREYVGCIEHQLGINFTDIEWNKVSDANEYLKLTAIEEADGKGLVDIGWEENAAKVIHDYLRSPEGQKAIRAYKDRGWQAIPPKFRLQILNVDNQPVDQALIRIFFKEINKKPFIGLTDINGEIQFYSYSPDDFNSFRMEYGSTGSFQMADLVRLTELDLTEYSEGVKIKYLA